MAGYYAPDKKKKTQVKIMPGEGYVGSCFKENEIRIIDNLPQGYAKLSSGLGETHPNHLAVIPIKMDKAAVGVFEIISLNKLEDHRIDFIDKLGEMLAANILTGQANEKIQKMYEEVKMQTEALKAQEEELRQNLEEMSATQEEMERQKKDFELASAQFKETEQKYKKEIAELFKVTLGPDEFFNFHFIICNFRSLQN